MTREEPLIITNNFTQEFFKGSKVEKGNNKQLGWLTVKSSLCMNLHLHREGKEVLLWLFKSEIIPNTYIWVPSQPTQVCFPFFKKNVPFARSYS